MEALAFISANLRLTGFGAEPVAASGDSGPVRPLIEQWTVICTVLGSVLLLILTDPVSETSVLLNEGKSGKPNGMQFFLLYLFYVVGYVSIFH